MTLNFTTMPNPSAPISSSQLLEMALGTEDRWEELHELCLDRGIAEQLAHALEAEAHSAMYHAAVWAGVLTEIHPGLRVKLPQPGVGQSSLRP